MEAEEDDSWKHNQPSPLLVDDTHPELQSNEQHCISKSIVEKKELPSHDIIVESSPLRDSLIMGTCSIVEEIGIVEEKVFPNIVEDMTEDSVKLMIESDTAETTFSGQRAFGELTEDMEEVGEKAVDDFVEDKVVYELGLADGNEKLVHGGVLVASLPDNAVEEGSAKREGETLAETSIYMPDAEVSDVINSVEKTEVVENGDDPDVVNEIGVPKKDTFATEAKDLGVPVSLVDESAMEEGKETNLADGTGEVVKMENVLYSSAEVGLTDSGGKIAEAGNVENAEDNIVGVGGMCVTDKTDEVLKMENLEEENAEVQGIVLRDGVEVLKIENVGDQDTEVQGTGVADEIADLGKIGSMVDETAEVKGIGVTDYTVEVENTEDLVDRTAHKEEIDLAEETAEADEIVYLVDETIGLEETDADETCMVEETEAAEEVEEMDVGVEADEASRGSSGSKRKRGKNSRAPARVPSRKTVEEDVCFICFDGGDLVLCDRRGCPKAYHPSCINRDDAFFRSGRWNCGWHLCSNCEKSAHYMCYTCTFSLCKGCIKNAVILCVRGNRGFCETCMKFVTLIEKTEHGDMEKGQIDFNDKNSWEFLFKEYWTDLKERLSLTSDELVHAKNPWKGSEPQNSRSDSPGELYDGNVDGGSGLEISENEEAGNSKKRRPKKRSKSHSKEMSSPSMSISAGSQGLSTDDNVEWASKELLEFVMHMRNGDIAALSQFDVQALLLEYIKRNKLRDPRRKSQIICDSRLENLFGKPRVGHFEMLKLLESHFLIKEDAQTNDLQGSIADTESSQLEADGHPDASAKTKKEKKRKARKKSDERGLQSNLDDYAAIDIHNINLIYFRRSLMEYLIEDEESFHDKVVGSFVRIRISGSAQKQDLYRLVQVVGTSKASGPYKVGKKTSDILLEILNLNKTEVISIDIISNQEFTEDECKRLRQSMKCGILNRLTVGDIQEKAMSLQDVRVKDWMETEIVRLSHLRDRASEKGRRKELRECVEKLQLLKTPEERQRRLEEIPEIHTDPKMDPSHESEDEDEADDRRQETYALPRSTSFGRRTREPVSPGKGGSNLNDSWTGMRNFPSMNRDLSSNLSSKAFSNHGDDAIGSGEIINEHSWSQGRDRDVQKLNILSPSSEIIARNALSGVSSDLSSAAHSPNPAAPPTIGTAQHASEVNESEKIWRYQDPSGKVQGPFSIVQLRKWSNTGYFPAELRIWKASDKQEDSLLLTDVLAGKIHKDTPLVDKNFQKLEVTQQTHHTSFVGQPHGTTVQLGIDVQDTGVSNSHTNPISSGQSSGGRWKPQIEVSSTGRPTSASIGAPKYSGDRWSSDYGNNNNFTSLPSPTPSSGGAKERQSQAAATFLDPRTLPGGNGGLQTSSFTPDRSMQASENDSFRSQSSLNPAAKTEKGMGLGPINALQVHPQPIVASNQQQHIQPSTSPNVPWGMGAPENQSTVPRPGLENQNQGWGPMPAGNLNMGWVATAHANANNMWGAAAQGSAPGSTNPGWIAPGQGPASGNPVQGWAAHNPMPPQVNPNPGWVAASQGPPPPPAPGNVNTSWPMQSGNQNMWGNEPGKNGDRLSNHRDGGGDYGNGGKSWGMQSSFGGRGGGGGGGGFSRPPYNYGQRVCIFHENGHCRKGASCDYIHN